MYFSAYNIPYPKPGCPKGEDYIILKKKTNMILCLLMDGVSGSSVREGPRKDWIQCRDFVVSFGRLFKKAKLEKLSTMIDKTLNETYNQFPQYQGTFVFVACCIYEYNSNYMCKFCYTGDSMLYVVRSNELIYKTRPTFFNKKMNVPMQIGVYGGKIQKAPYISKTLPLQKNDKIIICSDGVCDNLPQSKIITCNSAIELVQKSKKMNKKQDDISANIIIL